MFEKMIFFIDESLENIQVEPFMQKFNDYFKNKLYDSEKRLKNEYQFTKKCYFCLGFDSYNYISGTNASLQDKLNSKYCSSTNIFIYEKQLNKSLIDQREEINNNEPIIINSKFMNKFSDLKLLSIFKNRIEFNDAEQYPINKLIEISFDNNNLNKIPNFIYECENLFGLRISRNQIKSFNQKISPFEKLANLQLIQFSDLSFSQIDFIEIYGNNVIELPSKLLSLELHSIPFNYIPFNIENLRLKNFAFTGIKLLDLVKEFYSKVFNF
jgi:hypothetical protein